MSVRRMPPVCPHRNRGGVLCGDVTSVWRRFRRNASKLVYGLYDKRLIQQAAGRHPRHVGVVLDGNRRWAREAGFTDVRDGYLAGAHRIAELLSWCRAANVEAA